MRTLWRHTGSKPTRLYPWFSSMALRNAMRLFRHTVVANLQASFPGILFGAAADEMGQVSFEGASCNEIQQCAPSKAQSKLLASSGACLANKAACWPSSACPMALLPGGGLPAGLQLILASMAAAASWP